MYNKVEVTTHGEGGCPCSTVVVLWGTSDSIDECLSRTGNIPGCGESDGKRVARIVGGYDSWTRPLPNILCQLAKGTSSEWGFEKHSVTSFPSSLTVMTSCLCSPVISRPACNENLQRRRMVYVTRADAAR
jgi:hypothetical protein